LLFYVTCAQLAVTESSSCDCKVTSSLMSDISCCCRPVTFDVERRRSTDDRGTTWLDTTLKYTDRLSDSQTDRPKLLLMTNRKLHMRFQLAPNSMTLDDPELLKFKFSRKFALLCIFVLFRTQQRLNASEGWFTKFCPIYQGCCALTFALAGLSCYIYLLLGY